MRAVSLVVVTALAVELAVWEAFLVGARPFGTAFPVAAVLAVVGNVGLGLAAARTAGNRPAAALPGVVWLAVALTLGAGRAEGDRVVPDTVRGLAFLLCGTVAAAAVVGGLRIRTSPGASDGR